MKPPSRPPRREIVLDVCLLFALTAALIWPLFKVKYLDKWDSIESTFITDARFLRDHWPHPRWQPLWYGGTRFDYVYPPALRYGSAVLTKIYPAILPARGYHIYTAFFYCVGIAGVYAFVRTATGTRGAAWLAAAAAALLSPAYLLMWSYPADSWHLSPQRINVLVRYGEGPHMTAFALIPLALAASWRALPGGRPLAFAMAALASALVVSNNFYGATTLALFFALLVWSLWITYRDNHIWLRAAGIGLLAYGPTAFWLVPSYIRITLDNLKFVSDPPNAWSRWVAAVAGAGFAIVTWRRARGRPELAYRVFVLGAAFFLMLNVVGNHYLNFRVAGEPQRLVPELDLALILLLLEGLRALWAGSKRRRMIVVSLTVAAFGASIPYLVQPWSIVIRDPFFDRRLEYQISEWIARNLPGARTLASGSVRFWYDAWRDLPQLGGGSEQGLLNHAVMAAQWQILLGDRPQPAIDWMNAMGVDAVIVHEKHSREIHHDFEFPRKFAGALPVLWDNGQGDTIYKVPRRYPGLARVVDAAAMSALRPVTTDQDTGGIRAYAAAIDTGPDSPAVTAWEDTDAMRVRATLRDGQALLVHVSYDPAWHAYDNGRALAIRRDVLGQMLIDAPPGEHDIRLVFELPLENRVGRVISAIAAAVLIALVATGLRRKETSV